MLIAEKMLVDLVNKGIIKFTEKDLKGVKSACERKLLYSLGAYKGIKISSSNQTLFGIRKLKKVISANKYTNDMRELFKIVYKDNLNNFINITGKYDFIETINSKKYLYGIKNRLTNWIKYNKGKDLFIKGLGGFNIQEAHTRYIKLNKYTDDGLLTPENLIISGYMKIDNLYAERILEASKGLFKWAVIHKFDTARLDELLDLYILDQWNKNLSVNDVIKRLANIKVRGLNLTYRDKINFEYPENLKILAQKTAFTLPKNGIELKRQAKEFKNCSASYVDKIIKGSSYIMYTDTEMVEITKTGNIIQHYGKRNKPVDIYTKDSLQDKAYSIMSK